MYKGKYQIEVHRFDYYNKRNGNVDSGGKEKIAMWMLDTDYDGRSLFPKKTDPEDFIFCNEKDQPLNRRTMLRHFQNALTEAKIMPKERNIVPYSLRHGFDTDMLMKAKMYIVQILMGHSTDKMTRLYNHPDP